MGEEDLLARVPSPNRKAGKKRIREAKQNGNKNYGGPIP